MELEYFDTVMLQKYIDAGVPIFGICRGAQTMIAHFGGKLDQDYPQKYSSPNRGELVDTLKFTKKICEIISLAIS